MKRNDVVALATAAACTAALFTAGSPRLGAQQSARPVTLGTSAGINGLLSSVLLFSAADANKDNAVTREELRATLERWVASAGAADADGGATTEALVPVLNAGMPMAALAAALNMGGRGAQPQTPEPQSVAAMMAALPSTAPAKPAQPRKVLVLARAAGFVHSSIPLAARTIEALGTKTGAWSTTITYDANDITADNLKQYDAVFLASTTGAFLDDPADAMVTGARRQALLDFVRGGKGLAGIHAASDSYHASGNAGRSTAPAAGANPLAGFSAGATMAPLMIAQGDRNADKRLDRAEASALADAWFDALDARHAGRLTQPDFAFFALLVPKTAAPVAQGPDDQVGTWPDFNRLIGGYFKFHWLDPQQITVKVDDPSSPLTTMFKGPELVVHDEIYTMAAKSWSRDNVHVLTSIDYAKMSPEDRALEEHPRPDHDFGLSWIRREGQGRVFYEALGHSERIYATRPILEHLLAGMQYVLGDLKADDSPSRR
jgi:type 1 glutamine amidotransferase